MRGWLRVLRFRVARAVAPANRLVPEGWRQRLVRFPPAPEMPMPSPDDSPRLLIAPLNTAGQARQWARAVEREIPHAFAASMAFAAEGNGFAYVADQQVPISRYRWSSEWARNQSDQVVRHYSHVLIESGRAPFGDASGLGIRRQLGQLHAAGLRVGLVFHGSDIRNPTAHAARVPHSPFGGTGWDRAALFELRSRENASLAADLGVPTFVTTPDLLHDLPAARWLPVVVNPDPWVDAATVPAMTRTRPIVVHAPSVGRFKGSGFVDPVLQRLDAEGVIEYRRASRVPWAEMPALYGGADIVIDQVVMGIYGVAAIEAMHARRLVLAHVSGHTRSVVRERAGADVPVVEVRPETLEATIRTLVRERSRIAEIVDAGARFAADVHDGRYSVGVLREFLES